MAERFQPRFEAVEPSARTPRGEVALFGNLANRLQAFTDRRFSEVAQVTQVRAAERGREDALTGKLKLRNQATVAGAAYNNAGLRAYAAEVLTDIQIQVPSIEAQAFLPRADNLDQNLNAIEHFDSMASGYRAGVLEDVPAELRVDVQNQLDRALGKARNRVAAQFVAEEREKSRAATVLGLDALGDAAGTALIEGDLEGAQLQLVQYDKILDGSVADLEITPADALDMRDKLFDRLLAATITGQFDAAMAEDKGTEFLMNFAETIPEGMSPEDHEQLLGALLTRAGRRQQAAQLNRDIERQEREDRHREGERTVTLMHRAGSLTPETLTEMLTNDEISSATERKFAGLAQDTGPEFSDEDLYLLMAVAPEAFTEEQILESDTLTHSDQLDLIDRRDNVLKDLGNWRNSQAGQEGARRIKNDLGLPEGLIMSGMDKGLVREAGIALTEYFQRVENLPIEQRELQAIDIADEVIGKTQTRKDLAEADRLEGKLNEYMRENAERAKGAEEQATYEAEVAKRVKTIQELRRGR